MIASEMTRAAWTAMTDDERWEYAGRVMDKARDGAMLPYFGFNGGGPATPGSLMFVRVLLARHAGTPDAEIMRWYLNELRRDDRIAQCDVHAVLTVLKKL